MKKKAFIHMDEEGVSPVIATILMVAITVVLAAVLYIMVIGMTPPTDLPPTGVLTPPKYLDATTVDIEFAKLNPEPAPMKLEISLIRNGTEEGKYGFSSNDDGVLTLISGQDVGTLTYYDLADNQKVNIGDRIRLSDLTPNSDYNLIVIWSPSGDKITSKEFRTLSA